jgi:hypothetical protein
MSRSTSIFMTFSGLPLSGQTFAMIDNCFARHNFKPEENEVGVYVDSADEWVRGFTFKDRERILPRGSGIVFAYSALEEPHNWIKPLLDYPPELLCHELFFVAPIKRRLTFDKEERDWAKRVESLCLCLHQSLGAAKTRGRCTYDEEDRFVFSATEWKPMGELPLVEGE